MIVFSQNLPKGWTTIALKQLGELTQGGTPDTSNSLYWNGPYPFITGADITELYVKKGRSTLSEVGFNSSKTERAEVGNVLIVSRTCVGRIGIAATNLAVSQDVSVLKLKPGFDAKCVTLILLSYASNLQEAAQGATIKGLTRNYLENIKLQLPENLDEQKKLAKIIEKRINIIIKIRTNAEYQLEALQALPSAELRLLFSQKELPNGWKTLPLYELCEVNPAKPRTFRRNADAPTSFIPMEAVDEKTGVVIALQMRSYSAVAKGYTYFEEGDILFAKITPCMQNGKAAIVTGLIDGIGFGSTEFHVLRVKPGVDPRWIHCLVRSAEFRKKAEDNFEGSAGQRRVPDHFLKNVQVPFCEDGKERDILMNRIDNRMCTSYKMRSVASRQLEAISALPAATLREFFHFGENVNA